MARTKLDSHKKDFKTHEFIARDIFRVEICANEKHLIWYKSLGLWSNEQVS